jgi:aspartate aminotransferase-like enzyme
VLLEKVRIVLNDIKEEGLENVFKRHNRLARATRSAVQAFGLSMIAPDNPADSTQEYLFPMAWMEAS